jgi:prepilin peptidase CpaA
MVATMILLVWLLVAAVTDIRQHRIYNWTTYSGMALALAINVAGSLAESRSIELSWLGAIGLVNSLAGLLLCGVFMVVCFVFFPIGGGDVKLMAMIGAFLGWERGLEAMLWTFVLGACLGTISLAWRVGAVRLVSRAARQFLYTIRLRWFLPLSEEERRQLQFYLFLAPTAWVAVLIVLFVPM